MKKFSVDTTHISKRDFMRLCAATAGGCLFLPSGAGRILEAANRIHISGDDDLWKWSTEAMFCVEEGSGIRCLKCPNSCVLGTGDVGKCRNRVNHQGKVYSIAYGNPCAIHVDPIEKKPLFHFLPSSHAFSIAAAGCNLRCLNCQNWQISQVSPKETENADLMPERVVQRALEAGCESIAYTYSEPTTFYEYAYETASIARTRKVRNVWKSNGYIQEAPLRKLCRVLDAANIDLKCFDEKVYQELNGGSLAPVLRTLRIFKEEGVWLEITNLVIPTWTDDIGMIGKMCDWLVDNSLGDCPLHISRFTPMYKLNQLPSTPVATLEKARETAMSAGMRYVYIGNVPANKAENTYCHACGAMALERMGFVIVRNTLHGGKCTTCGARIPGVWS